ncbi:MAG TPA: nucleotidyltransferase family protein [Bryobacteraceae bacterium]|nr:nucleotidyltransferase family protein [Bryobacteraceae bacterium]
MKGRDPIDVLVPLLSDPPDLSALDDEQLWEAVTKNAGPYGVAPLVAFAVRPHVSGQRRQWCDEVLARSWGRHERMLRQLRWLTDLFEAKNVPTIALKGPALAERYYKPAFLRKPSGDLDLAVREEDLRKACAPLLREGYTFEVPLEEAVKRSYHVELLHASRPKVELHFRLSHKALGVPVDEFFERAVSLQLSDGREIQVLAPADQLLHLVLHLAQSRFGTLFHLCEIRLVSHLEPPAVRAEAIRQAADRGFRGAVRMVDIAFRSHWGDEFIPPQTLLPPTWLSWRLNEKLLRAFERWSEPGRSRTLATLLHGRWLDLQVTDSAGDAVRSLLLLASAARFQSARSQWASGRKISYGPDLSSTPARKNDTIP